MAKSNEKNAADDNLDRHWHLARTSHEISVTELEFALMRAHEAFARWQSECMTVASGFPVGGSENAILHVVRLHDRPKSVRDIARLTNRDDIANLQYALRKLVKLGLIEQSGGRANSVYAITASGRKASDAYSELRGELLTSYTGGIPNFENDLNETARTLNHLTGLYEQAARVVATHQRTSKADVEE